MLLSTCTRIVITIFLLINLSGCIGLAENLKEITLAPETSIRVSERAFVVEPEAIKVVGPLVDKEAISIKIDTQPFVYAAEIFADGFNQMSLMIGDKFVDTLQKEVRHTSTAADKRVGDLLQPIWLLVATFMLTAILLTVMSSVIGLAALRWYVKDKKSEIRMQNKTLEKCG